LKVSVIISVYNGAKTIRRCLESICNQVYPKELYEIIVIDDGSQDKTRTIIEQFQHIRLLCQNRRGPAAARNTGAEHAKHDILLFTDADCIPEPDWIKEMTAPFKDYSIAGVKGRYINRQKEFAARFIQFEYEEKYARMARRERIDFIDTYSAAYKKEIFLKFGGFDEYFPTASAEDIDFSFRLAQAGLQMVFNPKAIVVHQFETHTWGYLKKKIKNGFWRFFVISRYPRKLIADSHTPQIQKLQLVLFFFLVVAVFSARFIGIPDLILPLIILGYITSHLPSIIKIFHQDKNLVLIAPLFFIIRSTGLTLGMLSAVLVSIYMSTFKGVHSNYS
jgi:cellulose synthase/poly-beta-1,6-N-acetylglucosamine synthase-like glycosyltransferase